MTASADGAPLQSLPPLISVRGWTEEVNPAYVTFVEEMRSTGIEVIDIHVPPTGYSTMGEWAGAVTAATGEHRHDLEPLHLMAYCVGGNITLEVLHQLEAVGAIADFVAFIDVREDHEARRLERGIDALYLVPWAVRLRLAMIRLTPPDRESFGTVLGSVVRRSVRSVRELPKRGWRSTKRRRPATFDVLRLTYPWEFEGLTTPVHLYNTEDSLIRYGANDPSLHIGRNLWGGFVIRRIDGTHENCIEAPHSAGLIARITADRGATVAGDGVFG